MTAIDFVLKEFQTTSKLSEKDWLRKMEEYAVLHNSAVNLEHILSLSTKEKNALSSAVSALYYEDSSDYSNALCLVIQHLADIEIELLDEKMIRALHKLFCND